MRQENTYEDHKGRIEKGAWKAEKQEQFMKSWRAAKGQVGKKTWQDTEMKSKQETWKKTVGVEDIDSTAKKTEVQQGRQGTGHWLG